jgi:hypothetical protein
VYGRSYARWSRGVTVERITVHRFGMPPSLLSRMFVDQDWLDLETQYDRMSSALLE